MRLLLFIIAFLLIPFALIFEQDIYRYFYNKKNCDGRRTKRFANYGVPVPKGYGVYGLDVSHYSCVIDWDTVTKMNAEGVRMRFAFVRATRGRNFRDYLFDYNWKEAKKAGILRGAYHFYIANEDPATQAKNFLKTVKIEIGDLPPVLDIEDGDGTISDEQLLRGIKTWLIAVEHVTKVRPIIYCNLTYYQRFVVNHFDTYPIWVARYDVPKVALPTGRPWQFWQFSKSGRVNGITEKIDLNAFNGTYEQLKALTKSK